MSAGHGALVAAHRGAGGTSSERLDRVLRLPAVQERYWRPRRVDRSYDLPYLGGYSRDGSVVYIDRHFPEVLKFRDDGREYVVDPGERFIRMHEAWEWSIMDALNWEYGPAHRIAEAAEDRAVMMAGLPRVGYERALRPYIKADEHERLEKLPPDLDMRPYLYPPVDRRLIDAMEVAMGGKRSKKDVSYAADRGTAERHCGVVPGWPGTDCEHFGRPNSCWLVAGYIAPRGGCDLWERKEARK